jgi:hypothetical protein
MTKLHEADSCDGWKVGRSVLAGLFAETMPLRQFGERPAGANPLRSNDARIDAACTIAVRIRVVAAGRAWAEALA